MAQSVERLTLDVSSGHDLTVVSSSPALGSTLMVQSLLGILYLPLPLPPPPTHSPSLPQNKNKNEEIVNFIFGLS